MKQKPKPFNASSRQRDELPTAAELLPKILIRLSHGPANEENIIGALSATREPRNAGKKAFRSRAAAAINYLKSLRLVDRRAKKGTLFITDDGLDFIERLTVEKIQALSAEIVPIKGPRAPSMPESTPLGPHTDPEVLLTLSEQIELARRLLPRRSAPEDRAAAMAARMVLSVPSMPLDKMHALWINANERLSHPMEADRLAAKMVIEGINQERERRGPEATSLLPSGEYFRWPSTTANNGDGQLSFEADEFGVLARAGYRVGVTRGEVEMARLRILTRLFQEHIPYVSPGGEWGDQGTAQRLRKLAHTIAALTRNAKRRGPQMAHAVADWENDLKYLHDRFYVGRFDFPWPSIGR